MEKFVSFSKIGQFVGVIRDIKHAAQYLGMDTDGNMIMDRNAPMPTVPFKGTVKIHGTNAGVGVDCDNNIWFQSRSHIITPENDNAGFAFFASSRKDIFLDFVKQIREYEGLTTETIMIFGEWCGGSIQKGMSISGLDKMFVIFAIKVVPVGYEDEEEETTTIHNNYYLTDDAWADLSDEDKLIYNINDFESHTVMIDFNEPEMSRNKMIDIMMEVEKECPVGKVFGKKLGEDTTTGEGNVWVGWYNGRRYVFKVKGEKHSATKVKTLVAVDLEKLESIKEFVEYAVTENRLLQGIEQVFVTNNITPSMKTTGDFVKWVVSDVIAEELETLSENNLEPKEVGKAVSDYARKWYFTYLNSNV